MPAEELHRVRILAKRARYATEAVLPVLPAAARFAEAVTDLQNVLGEAQDRVVAIDWLRATGPTLDPAAAFAAGQLAGHLTAQATAASARDAWRPVAHTARRRRLRRWMRTGR